MKIPERSRECEEKESENLEIKVRRGYTTLEKK